MLVIYSCHSLFWLITAECLLFILCRFKSLYWVNTWALLIQLLFDCKVCIIFAPTTDISRFYCCLTPTIVKKSGQVSDPTMNSGGNRSIVDTRRAVFVLWRLNVYSLVTTTIRSYFPVSSDYKYRVESGWNDVLCDVKPSVTAIFKYILLRYD